MKIFGELVGLEETPSSDYIQILRCVTSINPYEIWERGLGVSSRETRADKLEVGVAGHRILDSVEADLSRRF